MIACFRQSEISIMIFYKLLVMAIHIGYQKRFKSITRLRRYMIFFTANQLDGALMLSQKPCRIYENTNQYRRHDQ